MRKPNDRPDLGDERGAVIILAAVMMFVLMALVGLAVDSGSLFGHKRALQTSADGGALQGGHEILRGNTSLITAAARTGSTENGYQHNVAAVNVDVYHPPVTGYYIGDNAAVEVVVSQPSPITFMTLMGWAPPTIPARAVAWAGANSKTCVHVLDPNDEAAFNTQSSHVINAPNCALKVNSSHNWGGRLESNSTAIFSDATFTGDYVEQSSSALITTNGAFDGVWPRAADPLAYMVPPNTAGCNHTDWEIDTPNITLWPGTYCGKFTLKNSTNALLMPGMYEMKGGPMKIEGDSVIRGTGVTMYFSEWGGNFEPFSFSSNARADLSAPTSGPYAGMLFWSETGAGNPDDEFTFESSSTHQLTGAIYFPDHVFNPESNTVINSDYLIIVVRQYIGESNSVINIGTNFPSGVSPLKRLALVE